METDQLCHGIRSMFLVSTRSLVKHIESKHIYEMFEMPLAERTQHEVIPNGQPRAEACSQRGDHIVKS